MTIASKRIIVALLAGTAAFVGVWAAAFPRAFHSGFPLPGRHWVSALGPYNEHLIRDVGGLYLALLVVSVGAWRHPAPATLRMAGGAWLVFNAIHFLWHALHLEVFGTADRIGTLVALCGVLILSILLLLPEKADRLAPRAVSERPRQP